MLQWSSVREDHLMVGMGDQVPHRDRNSDELQELAEPVNRIQADAKFTHPRGQFMSKSRDGAAFDPTCHEFTLGIDNPHHDRERSNQHYQQQSALAKYAVVLESFYIRGKKDR